MSESTNSAREIRRLRARRLVRRFAVWVALPVLIASAYYACVASPQYQSVAQFAVESPDSKKHTAVVQEFLGSRELLAWLQQEKSWSKHYSSSEHDWWSRMSGDATSEENYSYFRDTVEIESRGGTITLRVRAYSAEMAEELATSAISSAAEMLKRIGLRSLKERLRITSTELETTRKDLMDTRSQVTSLRVSEGESSGKFEQAKFELALREKAYEQAFTAHLEARRASNASTASVVTISAPSRPSSPTHPRVMWSILTVFALCMTLMVVVSAIVAGVREHGQF